MLMDKFINLELLDVFKLNLHYGNGNVFHNLALYYNVINYFF